MGNLNRPSEPFVFQMEVQYSRMTDSSESIERYNRHLVSPVHR